MEKTQDLASAVDAELFKKSGRFLDVLMYPNPTLDMKSQFIVSDFVNDEKLQQFFLDLVETCKRHNGAGLSAVQCGVPLRVLVVNVDSPVIMINPVVSVVGENKDYLTEGCLSFPGLFTQLSRPANVKVSYQTPDGSTIEEQLTGLKARVVQHEMDHLNGDTFLDRMHQIQKTSALKKFKNFKRKLKKL